MAKYLIPLSVAKCPGCGKQLQAAVNKLGNGHMGMEISCAGEPSTEVAWNIWSLIHAEVLSNFELYVAPLVPAIIEWVENTQEMRMPGNPRLN